MPVNSGNGILVPRLDAGLYIHHLWGLLLGLYAFEYLSQIKKSSFYVL